MCIDSHSRGRGQTRTTQSQSRENVFLLFLSRGGAPGQQSTIRVLRAYRRNL